MTQTMERRLTSGRRDIDVASDQQIREWARQNGFHVGERGRLPGNVIAAYESTYNKGDEMTETVIDQMCYACGTTAYWRFSDRRSTLCDRCLLDAETVNPPALVAEVAPAAPQTPILAPEPTPDLNTAAAGFAAAIAALAGTGAVVDEDLVRKIAQDVALEVVAEVATPKVVHVHVKDRESVVFEERTHSEFENVLKLLARKRNVYLYGPPGTGKSTIAVQAAKALGVPYGDISCEPTMPASKLFGFIDANGVFRDPLFFKIFTEGGVWNWEEIDNGHPGITAAMNTALANGHCAFPHGVFAKSDKFYCTATANTHGTGATRQFIGRNQLDAATLDRFVEWEIGIDEAIEEAGVLAEIADEAMGRKWLAQVRTWRANAANANLSVIISPRGAMNGAVMLDEGFTWEQAAKACVWKGIDATTRAKIEKGY